MIDLEDSQAIRVGHVTTILFPVHENAITFRASSLNEQLATTKSKSETNMGTDGNSQKAPRTAGQSRTEEITEEKSAASFSCANTEYSLGLNGEVDVIKTFYFKQQTSGQSYFQQANKAGLPGITN